MTRHICLPTINEFVSAPSLLALAIACALNAPAMAQSGTESIEEVQVTGTYIQGTDTAAANPVSTIDVSDEMKYTGASDVTELMNKLSVSSGAENRPDTFTSFYSQGTSNVNLRGLGLSSTLVLINGKRQTISGAKAQDGSVFVDTASIPAIAVERIDILKEGAAATYGSDAVAGVVNFVTRDAYDGVKLDGSYQKIDGFDQSDLNLSALGGFAIGDDTHVVMAASLLRRSSLQGFERPDLVQNAISGLGSAFKVTADTTVASGPWAGDYAAGDLVGNGECADFGGKPIGTHDSDNPKQCGFWYGLHYNIINEEEREQYYSALTHDFGNNMEGKIKAFYTDYRVIDNYSVPSLPNLNFPTIEASNSTNPFGVDVVVYGRHNPTLDPSQSRAAPRDNTTLRLEASLEGDFASGSGWLTSLAYSNNAYTITQPEMSLSRLNLAIDGVGGVSGTEQFDHFARPDQHDPALLDWLKTDFSVSTKTRLLVWDGVIHGEAFSLPAGQAHYALGGQLRNENYQVAPAANSAIVYDANGNPTPDHNDFTFLGTVAAVDQSRSTSALFAELEMPLAENLTLNAALRYEDLDTDNSIDPKLALLYRASDNLSLRASVSTSFREPSLSQMYADWVNTANVVEYIDPNDPSLGMKSSSLFIRIATTGSESLKPEQATNYNLGAIWSDEAFDARVDYWRVDYKDVITIENAQQVYNSDPFGSSVVYNNGTLSGMSINYFNAAAIDASGIDVEASYTFDLLGGGLALSGSWSRYLQYEVASGGQSFDAVGSFNFGNFVRSMPEDKANLMAHWQSDKHSVYARVNYVSEYTNNRQGETIDSFAPVDVQYRFSTDMSGGEMSLAVGVINAFDEAPPLVHDAANFSFDPKQHDPRGRMVYLQGSYAF